MKRRRKTSQPKPLAGEFQRGRGKTRGRAGNKERQAEPGTPPAKPEAAGDQSVFYGEIRWQGALAMVRLMKREMAMLPVQVVDVADGVDDTFEDGEVVRVRLRAQGRNGMAQAQVLENLGQNPPGLASMVAMENFQLPKSFPVEVENAAESLKAFKTSKTGGERSDWRGLNIVTIDGADARDFDDAVWAEPVGVEGQDGYRIIVAIADVANYVPPGSVLDIEARARGNSTYLPGMVIPMLPERLSNDLCSLRPKEDRPVVGVEMWIDTAGKLLKHQFHRGVIHSAARLTYEQVQAALDGAPNDTTRRLKTELQNLLGAFNVLAQARGERGAIDLDLPEAQLVQDAQGRVIRVDARARLTAHRLIEELMILANVAAAETLSRTGAGGLYRIHDRPDKIKQQALKAALGPLGFSVPAPEAKPKQWAVLAAQLQEHPASQSLLRLVLQSQQQARYSPDNIGHYGLALPLYAHFTSPIRRYSDLVVHRALIAALKLADGAGEVVPQTKLADWGEHLQVTERNSQRAEWEARDRMIAEYYEAMLGDAETRPTFDAVVVSVQTFGCFVAIDGVAEGLLPARLLGHGWQFYAAQSAWMRREKKLVLRPGSRVSVRLIEADRVAGRLTFAPAQTEENGGRERPRRAGREFGRGPERSRDTGRRR